MALDQRLVVAFRRLGPVGDLKVLRRVGVEQLANGRRLSPSTPPLPQVRRLAPTLPLSSLLVWSCVLPSIRDWAESPWIVASVSFSAAVSVAIVEHVRQHAALELLQSEARQGFVRTQDRSRDLWQGVDIALRQIDRRPLIWTTSRRTRTTFGGPRPERGQCRPREFPRSLPAWIAWTNLGHDWTYFALHVSSEGSSEPNSLSPHCHHLGANSVVFRPTPA